MSKNKDIRKKLEGQRRALEEHQAKLNAELSRSEPDPSIIEGWRHTIRNIERQIAKLERRLRR